MIIWLKHQPAFEIAQPIRATVDQEMEELASEARAIRQKAQPTPAEKARLRSLFEQIEAIDQQASAQIAREIRAVTDGDQEKVKELVKGLGGKVSRKLTIANAIVALVRVNQLETISNLPGVSYVGSNFGATGLLNVSAEAIGADAFWDAGYDGGGAGEIFDFGIVDDGIDSTHTDLDGQRFFGSGQDTYQLTPTQWDTTAGHHTDADHGTHVAGIAVSTHNTYQGIAYGIDAIISYGVAGNERSYEGIDWVVNHNETAEVINHSRGKYTTGWSYTDIAKFLDAAVDDRGKCIVQSFGNGGSSQRTEEGLAYNVISVGAMDDKNTSSRSDDTIWSSSSTGPTNGVRKPDLVAPGVKIISPDAQHETQPDKNDNKLNNPKWEDPPEDEDVTGTSFAAPHVTGAVLLLKDACIFNHKAIKAILINNAEDKGSAGWDPTYGWGYVDLDSTWAHRDYVTGTLDNNDTSDYFQGTMSQGDRATLVWNRHVVYNGANPPETVRDLTNLNLYLYDSNGDLIDSSTEDTQKNVEQVSYDAQGSETVKIEVRLIGSLPTGVSSESYAVAVPGLFQESGAPKRAVSEGSRVPRSFLLSQSYPNPFNATTVVYFELPKASRVKLEIYNASGQKLRTLVDERQMKQGRHSVTWEGKTQLGHDVASGVYFYHLTAGDFTTTRKMLLLR